METNNNINQAELSAFITAFITDLMLLTSYAKKKGVSKDAVYKAIKTERIREEDLIWIDKYQYIRWSQYKHITFRDKHQRKKNPNAI